MKSLKNIDSNRYLRGEALYVDDINIRKNTLFGVVFDSPIAHGKIKKLSLEKALSSDGIIKILTYKDIPGENQIGSIIPDEPLLAEEEVHFKGQPIALIIADSIASAKKAKKLIEIEIEELPIITTASEAKLKKQFINIPRTFKLGDTKEAFKNCDYVFSGTTFSNGQEHLYIETQGAYAEINENNCIKITSSTQGPTAVQKAASTILGVGMHKIEVDVIRLGGGFGGKEDQATPWAAMAALGAYLLKKPVKLILSRHDDLRMTGKRHPYESSFKIGLNKELKIIAFEAEFLQNAGASSDLSPAVAERTLFHATNSYFIKNVTTSIYSCKTNLPPNTAFRGFGGPQGMFVIESAIAKAASELNIATYKIQEANLLKENDEFSYGQIATQVEAISTWKKATTEFNLKELEQSVKKFNTESINIKKGLSVMPIAFGISFTNTRMNQARALVHIYLDGTVGISTGAVEMGQGVNTKLKQLAADYFCINADKIKIETTNTSRVANTSPSAASSTTDLNGKALLTACEKLKERLTEVAAANFKIKKDTIYFKDNYVKNSFNSVEISWEELILLTYSNRISLSEKGHYATPEIHFDKSKEKGHPFAYHVYGTAIFKVSVDCIRGNYTFDSVQLVHDYGKSMNLNIDLGQTEGGLIQGIGWMTTEEIAYDKKGNLLSNALSTYKVPDLFSIPEKIEIIPLKTEGHQLAINKSKAVGEPPLLYGLGAYFAIQNAVKAFNPNYKIKFDAPFTPEKVLLALYS